jgi:hypothetical protein
VMGSPQGLPIPVLYHYPASLPYAKRLPLGHLF